MIRKNQHIGYWTIWIIYSFLVEPKNICRNIIFCTEKFKAKYDFIKTTTHIRKKIVFMVFQQLFQHKLCHLYYQKNLKLTQRPGIGKTSVHDGCHFMIVFMK